MWERLDRLCDGDYRFCFLVGMCRISSFFLDLNDDLISTASKKKTAATLFAINYFKSCKPISGVGKIPEKSNKMGTLCLSVNVLDSCFVHL